MATLDSLRAFIQVVTEGGFAAAARSMNLSRSVVNRAVIKLENELNAPLLQRSTRKVVPTEAGLAFYERCRHILNDLDEAMLSVSDHSDNAIGSLRINGPMSFGTMHLSNVVAEFMGLYPDVHVELLLNDRFIDPIEEGFDITLRIGAPQYRASLVAKPLTTAKRVVCASPDYLATQARLAHPDDLKSHRCLHYGYQDSGSQWRLSEGDSEHLVPIGCVMYSNNGEVLRDAAIGAQGIALLPTFIVGQALRTGRLVTVLPGYTAPPIDLCALYPRHRQQSAKVRLFVDLLVKRFGDIPYWDQPA